MKNRFFTFGSILAYALAAPLALSAAEMKVGVYNVQDVLETIEEGKKAKAQLQQSIDGRKKDLESRQKEIKRLDEAFEKQKLILSASALEEKRKELEEKKIDIQKAYMNAQSETQKQEMELTGGILKKIRGVVEKYGKDGGYSMILERTEASVSFYKDGLDLTKQITDEYNKAYKK